MVLTQLYRLPGTPVSVSLSFTVKQASSVARKSKKCLGECCLSLYLCCSTVYDDEQLGEINLKAQTV